MAKYHKINNISSEAVEKATGHGWDYWVKLLDKENCKDKTHTEIAELIMKKGWLAGRSLKSEGWWAQMVTVGYEYAKGKRIVGKTLDQGFAIGVQKMIPVRQEILWAFINSDKGKKLWQGSAKTEIRTIKEGERLRLSYNDSVLQITLICKRNTQEKTNVNFHQEKLHSTAERNKMRKHWKAVLEKIQASVTS